MLLTGLLWTFVVHVQAQLPSYAYFQLKVYPQYVSADTFLMTVEAKNVSEHHFRNGDVTVSFKQDISASPDAHLDCEVIAHKATAIRRFPQGSKIYSVEKDKSILSDDLIVQALQDNWRPGQVVQLQLKLVVRVLPLKIFLRVAAKLENEKALVFEPTDGGKDQQGLCAEPWLIDRVPMNGDIDGDGSEEVLVEWKKGRYGTVHLYQVYKKKSGEYERIGEFELEDMPQSRIEIVEEPGASQPAKLIIVIQFNSSAGTYYLLRRDGTSADRVTVAMQDEHADLDGDGIYEWAFFHKHSDSRRVRLVHKAKGLSVFEWDRAALAYREAWPPNERNYALHGGVLHDVDQDGHADIVALTDTGKKCHPERYLSIFKCSAGRYRRIAQLDVTLPAPAIDILAIRRLAQGEQILLQLQNEHRSLIAGYNFRGGQLQKIWVDERIKADYPLLDGLIRVVDIDGDSEEEILFLDKEAGQQIVIRGSNDFSILVPEDH